MRILIKVIKSKLKKLNCLLRVFFRGNILLIDSPGLDAYGLENHEKLTLENLLPTIDVCIFVTTLKIIVMKKCYLY